MKNISIIALPAVLLSMSLGIVAAQDPVQEPIPELQWQRAGRAFMPGLYPHAGAGSIVSQLPQHVAKDIVEFAKPKEGKENFGFIKNYTDKPIDHLTFWDCLWHESYAYILSDYDLAPHHQIFFMGSEIAADFTNEFIERRGTLITKTRYRRPWPSDIKLEFRGEPFLREVKRVYLYCYSNLNFYKEGDRIRLDVTSPAHKPESYYAAPIERL